MMNKQDLILDDAFKAYNQGDYRRAEGLARNVLSLIPSQGDALYLLGLIAYQEGALEPAAELLFQAAKLYPKIENYTLMLASVLQRQNRLDEALSYYEKFPKNAKGLTEQGFIYLQKKQAEKAKTLFEQAITENSQLAEAQLGLALCLQDDKLLRQVSEKSNLPDAWYQLSILYLKQDRKEESLSAIDKTGLEQVAYLVQKGLVLESLGEVEGALAIYQRASQKNPFRADVWANQANIFRNKGEYSAAEDYYKRALAQDFDDIPSRHNLAELLYRQGRVAEALEQYRAVLIRNPQYIPSLYNLAIILENREEYAEALGLYFKVLLGNNTPKDIEWRIADSLSKLASIDDKSHRLAIDFAKGWIKNFSQSVIAAHTYASLTQGEDKNTAEYVKALYDSFAETYDDKMKLLESKALEELIALLPHKKYADVLDLGCGTGAFGKYVGLSISHLTGIDLSEKMIEKAKTVSAYQDLICDETLHFFKNHPKKYDLITAVEMFSYCPDIRPLISQIAKHLKVRGLCAFTIETTPESKPKLSISGRYLYPADYVVQILKKHKLTIKGQRIVSLRKEGKGFADGLIILAGRV